MTRNEIRRNARRRALADCPKSKEYRGTCKVPMKRGGCDDETCPCWAEYFLLGDVFSVKRETYDGLS